MRHFCGFLALTIVCFLASCKSKQPKGVLDEATMERLLYDYHLAQGMANASADSSAYKMRLYCGAVFKKYGITEAEFNGSMEWYARHLEDLLDIYKRVNERLEASVAALGSVPEGAGLAGMRGQGDTMNVWKGRDFALLSANGVNRLAFSQQADTAYRPGDRLMWQFSLQWVYREGMKSAIAVLAVRYDNDSVDTSVQYLYGSGLQKVSLNTKRRTTKEVYGFIYQNTSKSEKPKLLLVSQISLIRFHVKAQPELAAPVRHVETDSMRHFIDSIQGQNQETSGKPHFKEIETTEPVRPLRVSRERPSSSNH